ncbi:hypothetical protein ACFX13_031972 [Malus domestica]
MQFLPAPCLLCTTAHGRVLLHSYFLLINTWNQPKLTIPLE